MKKWWLTRRARARWLNDLLAEAHSLSRLDRWDQEVMPK